MQRILLIEDDVFLREMYLHVFEKEGYVMAQAGDGQEGIDMANADTHDLILLDIMMPRKSGIDVLRELRLPTSSAKNTPIILLSNLGQESVIQEAYNIGADGYLLKADLLPRQVLEKVADFLSGKLTKKDFLSSQSME